MRRALVVVILAVAVAAGLWWKRDDALRVAAAIPGLSALVPGDRVEASASAGPPRRVVPAVPVVLATAEKKPLPVTIEAVGTVQPLASIQLKARIDSQISAINVQEGAKVKEGDLLVTLDSRALRAQLAQADATVAKDRAQLDQSRRDLARADDLLAKRINSEVQRDTAATAVKVQESQLAADEAQRENLAASLTYTEIRAPVSGRIGSITLKAGTTLKAGDALAIATVNQINPIFVSFAVPQSLFADLRRAQATGTVKVDARVAGGTISGQLSFVENTVDLATGTVLVRATMANDDERLWPGSFVAVQAVLGIQSEAVAIPSSAVQIGQQGAYVFVVRDGAKAELVPVKVDRTIGSDSILSAGLLGGEKVVVDGQLRLVNGSPVQVQSRRENADVAKRSNADTPERRS